MSRNLTDWFGSRNENKKPSTGRNEPPASEPVKSSTVKSLLLKKGATTVYVDKAQQMVWYGDFGHISAEELLYNAIKLREVFFKFRQKVSHLIAVSKDYEEHSVYLWIASKTGIPPSLSTLLEAEGIKAMHCDEAYILGGKNNYYGRIETFPDEGDRAR